MADQHDYQALEWVKGEIEETLKQAQQSLEAFEENPDDSSRMRFCLAHLHQVTGTLQMVEFYGAALVAEEMENLAIALINEQVQRIEDAQEVLMRAILQLPEYLERIKDGQRDMPVLVLPLLNDLRAARGEHLLSETVLFKPDLQAGGEAAPKETVSQEALAQLPELLKKIRQLYQFALVGLIRNQDMPTNLGYMAKSLAKLEQLYSNTPMGQLWWVSAALVEGVSRNYIELGTSVKMLFGQLDRQLKNSIDTGAKVGEPVPTDLLKNLLFYVAGSEGETARIGRVKEAFRLDSALPSEVLLDGEQRSLSGPGKSTIASVVTVLLEELGGIKETLDLFMRGDAYNTQELRTVIPALKQVSDTLAVLGVGNPRRVIAEQIDTIGRMIESQEAPDDNELMDIAGALLYVEATLQGMAHDPSAAINDDEETDGQYVSPEQISKARSAVIEESRAGLENAKDAISEYISSDFDSNSLQAVPDILHSVRGGLLMVPLSHPAALLQSCILFISERLIDANERPHWKQLDTLADAITSVEYYLERLGDRFPGDEDILAIAEDAVANLGYPAERIDSEELAALQGDSGSESHYLESGAESEQFDLQTPASVGASETETAELEEELQFDLVDGEEDEFIQIDFSEDEIAEAPSEPEPEEEDDLIDEEVIEIFIEEAGEVLETINEYLPQWISDYDNEEALKELRRAYHTLKGSGRMVGATVVGELAWSVENMLNRVLDKNIETTTEVTGIVERVTEVIPQLVKAFEDRVKPDIDVDPLAAVADALAKGETPPSLPADLRLDAAAPAPEEAPPVVEEIPEAEAESLAPETPGSEEPESEIDSVLVDIFSQEASSHLETLKTYLNNEPAQILSDDMLRALHTLKGSAHMAGIQPIADLAAPTERFYKECHLQGVPADDNIKLMLGDFVQLIEQGLEDLMSHPAAPIIGSEEYLTRLNEMREDKLKHAHDIDSAESGKPDPQLVSVFLAEAMDLIMDAGDELRSWENDPVPGEKLDQLRQELRILARSATAAQLNEVVGLSMTLEELYEAASNGMVTPDDSFFRAAHDAHEELVTMMDFIAAGQPANPADETIARLQSLMDQAPQMSEQLDTAHQQMNAAEASETDAPQPDAFTIESLADQEQVLEAEPDAEADSFAVDAFDTAASAHEADEAEDPLKTFSLTEDNADLASQQEPIVDDSEATGFELDIDDADLVVEGDQHDAPPELQTEEFVISHEDDVEEPASFNFEEIDQLEEEPAQPEVVVSDEVSGDYDPELVEIFLEEASEILDTTAEQLQSWIETPDDLDIVAGLQRNLHTLKGGARMSDMKEMGDLGHHLENLYEGLCMKNFTATPVLFDLLHQCHDRLAVMFESIQSGQQAAPADDLIGKIDDFTHGRLKTMAAEPAPEPEKLTVNLQGSAFATPAEQDTSALSALGGNGEELDTEILEIFIEEAEELTEGIDNTINAWLADRDNQAHLDEMKRLLHTLKGGARLAGLVQIGNMSHNFESFLIQSETDRVALDDAFFSKVQSEHDRLFQQMEHLSQHGSELILSAGEAESAEFEFTLDEDIDSAVARAQQPESAAEPETLAPLQVNVAKSDVFPASAFHAEEVKRASGESIKVPSELMEGLVNLAGETSIFRGRIEQEITDFNHVIDEVGMTIERAKELVRRLDIETEAQILHRYQQAQTEGQEYEDFDPLEMDRYSTLNQISRSLGETVSDMIDLRDSLVDRTRDAETLLIQQGRINSELQESLMRTRMVPFSRMVPRLRRIVRQIAGELGKKAELEIIGAEGEMDRTVLERMVPPLEHMLRNAVDHGLEMPEERVAKNKKETGRITIHLAREGGEVVLRLTDDGKGINLDGVKNRAIERGLMKASAPLTDKEIMQFIFKPGFSTAEKVTQISGRGVGMDVVHSEIKQLGGSVKLHSAPGSGSQFTVRLPFTVSVNRALMVRVGEDLYAIPLNNIEGIVRVSPYELEAYYQPDAPSFEYAGQQYGVRYLGRYVHNTPVPNLSGHTKPLPVLLVRGVDHAVALQVDSLLGSREVVVKSVGPQLAAVSGISGATILGDGSVVIILDLSAVIRAEQAQIGIDGEEFSAPLAQVNETPLAQVNETPLVMVIDDSVTVRKVTSRLLERNGFEVVTAKDGVDAITQLQDIKPDVMLLDIEMPRMDGFEVATLVRHDERLKDTPIIMITSRTGEKHRDRAMSIGVNRYLGKPYQETVLLETIDELIKQEA
ncbi:response regulator [Ketobacter sp. MCCC 1A13808]|uniref:Hpt domain-containing protein n=1 Tax=Ketobacter sp. MCCC 1A13808 TaxID=2602738 RepID=UPI0012EB8029|nr:Hpt domain-containing protein [Ketobacter sp. MCCC 1A13808]MVF13641.1 response regulator [Ketobacter sp. MCCC 1A13808]